MKTWLLAAALVVLAVGLFVVVAAPSPCDWMPCWMADAFGCPRCAAGGGDGGAS